MYMISSLYAQPIRWSLRLRFIGLFLIAGFCWFIEQAAEENISLAIVIIAGLSHCVFAYLYRFRARGSEPIQYGVALAALALLVSLTYILPAEFFVGVVAVYFVVHFLLDEAFLSDEKISSYSWLRIAPIAVLYWFYYACYLTAIDMVWAQIAAYFSVVLFAAWLIFVMYGRRTWGLIDWHYLSIYILSFFFVTAGVSDYGKALFDPLNFLVISHVANWYIHQGIKIGAKGRSILPFLREVFWVNVAIAFLFIAYYSLRGTGLPVIEFLGFFFQPTFFYIWIMLHFISSVRMSDFRSSAA